MHELCQCICTVFFFRIRGCNPSEPIAAFRSVLFNRLTTSSTVICISGIFPEKLRWGSWVSGTPLVCTEQKASAKHPLITLGSELTVLTFSLRGPTDSKAAQVFVQFTEHTITF